MAVLLLMIKYTIPADSWLNSFSHIFSHFLSPNSITCARVIDTEHCVITNISQYNISLDVHDGS